MFFLKLVISVFVFLIAMSLINYLLNPYDDTDNFEKKERSGMRLYTDHKTGCQYLRAGLFSGLTPRLGADGKQICTSKDSK